MPLRELIADTDGSAAADSHSDRYGAQSWALAHLLLVGGGADHALRLKAYLRDYRAGADDAFSTAFEGDYEGLQRDLAAYVAQSSLGASLRPRPMAEQRYRVAPAAPGTVESALTALRGQLQSSPQAYNSR
jgi:hypothetical protein